MARPAVIGEKICSLLRTHHLLSAVAIVELLKNQEGSVNKTTVYRALEKLSGAGLVCKQTLGKDEIVYEIRDHHHDHIVCTHCGKTQSIACATKTAKNVEGFSIDHHHTTFFGLCNSCQK